eukprot:scaffold13457_cov56-Phaeocystis_antarctica.AAC.2
MPSAAATLAVCLGLLADGGLAYLYSPPRPSCAAVRLRGQAIAAPRPRLALAAARMQQPKDDAELSRGTDAVDGTSTAADSYTRLLSVLAAGDAAVFVLFAGIGRGSHATDTGNALTTAAPFLAAWAVLAPPLGAYPAKASRSVEQAAKAPLVAWLVAVPSNPNPHPNPSPNPNPNPYPNTDPDPNPNPNQVAVPCGCALRGLLQGRMPAAPFWIIALVFTLGLLEAWRLSYYQVNSLNRAMDQFAAAIVDEDEGGEPDDY